MTQAVEAVTDALPISEEQKQQVSETAGHLAGLAESQIQSQAKRAIGQAGDSVTSVADALRQSSTQLNEQGQSMPANMLNMAADRTEQMGSYLKTAEPGALLNDAEHFLRRQPWVVVAGGLMLGFLGARFLKASSTERYNQYRYTNPYGGGYPSATGTTYGTDGFGAVGYEADETIYTSPTSDGLGTREYVSETSEYYTGGDV